MRRRIIVIFGVALLVFAAGYFAYRAYFTPEAIKRREVAKWVNIIGTYVELPHGETPTLATVTNRNKLDGQVFFERAQNGDRILIYLKARQAFLYRPATGKIVDMTTDVLIERK